MIEQIFEEYNISETELRQKIINTLTETYRLQPNEQLAELITHMNGNPPILEIIALILNPDWDKIFDEIKSNRLTELDLLRLCAYHADFDLDNIKLKNLILKQFSKNFFNFTYGIIFVFIVIILVEKQGVDIDFDRDLIHDILSNPPKNLFEVLDVLRASIFVKSLIDRFASDEANSQFSNEINRFCNQMYDYLEQNIVNDCYMSSVSLLLEAQAKFLDDINDKLQFGEPISATDKREYIEAITKIKKQVTKNRVGYEGRGGKRERKGFKWVDSENKIRFYETVENLPEIKGKPLWEYAYENINENDFHYKYIDYLKSLPEFQNVPDGLFQDAVRTWRKYKDSLIKPLASEQSQNFAFQHALHLLDFPNGKYSSLKRYYGEGKKLFRLNGLNNEKSK